MMHLSFNVFHYSRLRSSRVIIFCSVWFSFYKRNNQIKFFKKKLKPVWLGFSVWLGFFDFGLVFSSLARFVSCFFFNLDSVNWFFFHYSIFLVFFFNLLDLINILVYLSLLAGGVCVCISLTQTLTPSMLLFTTHCSLLWTCSQNTIIFVIFCIFFTLILVLCSIYDSAMYLYLYHIRTSKVKTGDRKLSKMEKRESLSTVERPDKWV